MYIRIYARVSPQLSFLEVAFVFTKTLPLGWTAVGVPNTPAG